MKNKNILMLSLLTGMTLPAAAQKDSTRNAFVDQPIEVGANKTFTRETSTASVSVIRNKDVDNRGVKNIGNSILGQGNGLMSLQGTGTYYQQNPTFYIRGLQSLSTSTPLLLVDGIERNITFISADEVEEVQILKDAAAVALYGYKGANGAILIKTKRGKYNDKTIKFTYDHEFRNMTSRPKFVDGATYASAMNEALANEGQEARYSDAAIAAYRNGSSPYRYPNVNWVGETFRNHALDNHFALEFSGGGEKFRYFTMANLISDKGFIKSPSENDGYSTQDKYVRANVRTNLDIDLTPTTMLRANILGMLSEQSRPGSNVNLWSMVYSVPSIAFPIKNSNGAWGGSSTWAGTSNPVAQSTGAAYYKTHERALYFDATLNQDLKAITPGLSGTLSASYDIYSTLYEDHSKEYLYGYYTSWLDDTTPDETSLYTGGKQGEMGSAAATNAYQRRLTFAAAVNYDRSFDKHDVYGQLKYDYEFNETTGLNTKVYRQNISLWAHYGYAKKYLLDLALVESGSSRLAPGTKWAFSPTVSAGWVLSRENFLKDSKWLDFLKLRASYGIINADYLPGDAMDVWTYYQQAYGTSGIQYPWGSGYDSNDGSTTISQMPAVNPSHEKARKINVGFDATLFKGLNIEFDYFWQHRYDIWVDGAGAYSALIGFDAPYTNEGVVDQHGLDVSLDYTKTVGDFTFNVGATFTYAKNKIKDEAEEPRAYDNLVETGNPLSSTYGLIAEGLFTSQAEIDASPTQTFSTVRPGDIKYKDVNGDGVIDANDKCKIGYSTACPEIYYTFHLGAEWKGLGIDAQFQGTGHYSAVLNTSGYYWGLINNTNLSQYVYDNRWTSEYNNAHALFPRLSSTSNANNYQTSTFWLRDRSFLRLRSVELYYYLPKSLMAKTGFMKAAKVYVKGSDLFHINGFGDYSNKIVDQDPEVLGQTTPASRSVIVGAQLTF